jgi:hypothetical protein
MSQENVEVLRSGYAAIGQESGAAAEARAAHEFTIRDGLPVRFKAYLDRSEALEAVGLRE